MKKLLLLAIAAFLMVGVAANAQSKKELKGIQKEAKALAKNLKKEGYTNLEMGLMEGVIERYMTKLRVTKEGESRKKDLVGVAYGYKTLNLAKQAALNNAINEYASQCSGVVKARIVSELSTVPEAQVDNMIGGFERILMHSLKGELQLEVTMYREKRKQFDVRAYCIIDFDAARTAAKEAMKQALEEQELYQQYGSNISSWINEGMAN